MTMRKKFVYFFLIPLVVLSVVVYIFLDRWVESGLESAGEAILGAKVEIDNLHVSLSPIAIQFSRLQAANPRDPWKNVFETGMVRFALNFGQLLRGKYIIETMELNNLVFGTKRLMSGALPKTSGTGNETSVLSGAVSFVVREAQKAPVFDLNKIRKELNIDSLLNVQNLRSVQYIDTLKLRVREADQQWRSTLNEIEQSKQRVAEIQASIAAIKLNELKTVENFTAALSNANNAYKGLNDLNEAFKGHRTVITEQLNRLSTAVGGIDDVARADYEMVRRLAKLPDLSTQGLAKLLVGREILGDLEGYLSWVDFARTAVPRYAPKPEYEKPERSKGQNILFPVERSYPKLWIKKIAISASEDKSRNAEYFSAHGEVQNIADNQHLTGLPLTIALAGSKAGGSSYTVDASFDRRTENPVDTYRITASNLAAGDLAFGQSDFLPSRITHATVNASAAVVVPGSRFDANINLVFRDLLLLFDRLPRNDVERITREVLASLTGFTMGLRIWNVGGPIDVALTTNLDDLLAARTKKVLGGELTRLQNDIRAKVAQRIAEKRMELEKLFSQKKDEALGRLGSYQALVNQNLATLDGKKKEIEARIEKEKSKQTDAAKKKLEDAVKGLFKKQ